MPDTPERSAVLLARVSTPEQEQFGQSLESQVACLREYAQRHNIAIVKEFVFQETAGAGIRKRFEEVMRYLKTHRGANILLAQNVDRVTRNYRDAVDLDEMRLHRGLEIHFIQENIVINAQSSGAEMAVWDVRVFSGRQLLLRMRDQAISDHRRQAKEGKWAFKAPLGYRNIRDPESGKCDIVLDCERAPLIRQMFEDYATGLWSICELQRRMRNRGLTTAKDNALCTQSIGRMLRNSFYCGVMGTKSGQYTHDYERIISNALFERCQSVLKGRAVHPPKLEGRPFIFRGLLRCAASGRAVSTDAKVRRYKSGNTQEFTYLTPRDPKNHDKRLWVREEVVLKQVGTALNSFHFPPSLMEALLPSVEQACKDKQELRRHSTRTIEKQQREAVDQLDRLTDLAIKGLISEEELRRKRATLLSEQRRFAELMIESRDQEPGANRLKSAVAELVHISTRLKDWFAGSKISQKRRILSFVFSNLQLHGRKLQYKLNPPFDRLFSGRMESLVPQREWVANLLEPEARAAILEILPKLQELGREIEGSAVPEWDTVDNADRRENRDAA